MKLKLINYSWSFRTPNSSMGTYELVRLRAANESLFSDYKAVHEENLTIIQANQAAREKLIAVAKEIGLPNTYRDYDKKSRAKNPPLVTFTAGYLRDLDREFPVYDGWDEIVREYASICERIEKREQEIQAKDEELRKAELRRKELEQRKKDAYKTIAKMEIKYGDGVEASDIAARDPLLALAAAGEETRNDWSDGCYRVENVLNDVKEWPEIYAVYVEACSDFEDGRVFRDMRYGYPELYTLVDAQLVEDYHELYNAEQVLDGW